MQHYAYFSSFRQFKLYKSSKTKNGQGDDACAIVQVWKF